MTHRAPRSEEELVDALGERPSPERSASGVVPPSLVTALPSVEGAGSDAATPADVVSRELQRGVEVHPQIELPPKRDDEIEQSSVASPLHEGAASAERAAQEPSSRELTGAELDSEQLDALEGIAASSVGEPAPISESEEVTSDQLIQDGEAPPVPIDSAPSGPYQPIHAGPERQPWVDQVADPVTPYEQRVSEMVRVADLPPMEQLRGRVLANRYLAEELAEQSSASLSYRAYHLALDSAVTVRILPRGLACSDELCQEVRSAARVATQLEHPNVAATLDFGVTTDGWPFLVTDNLQGRSLSVTSIVGPLEFRCAIRPRGRNFPSAQPATWP